jgi:hypothetical protein
MQQSQEAAVKVLELRLAEVQQRELEQLRVSTEAAKASDRHAAALSRLQRELDCKAGQCLITPRILCFMCRGSLDSTVC